MLKKIKVVLLYLIIFTLPFNIRHIFNFADLQNITGFREHLTIAFYLFDILFILLFIISIWENRKKLLEKTLFKKIFKQPLIYLTILVVISLFYNQAPFGNLEWYKITRFIEIVILFIIVKNVLKQYTVFIYFKFILFTSGIIQSTIAILQFITQKSLGLGWLGESIIGPDIYGVAKFSFEGEELIRAYGTFPHPNILGIFLLFSLGAGLSLIISKKILLSNLRWHWRSIFFGEFIILYIGILLTYSRSIITLTAILSLSFAYSQRKFIVKTYKNLCEQLHIPFFLQTTLAIIIVFGGLFASYNILTPRLCVHCPDDKSMSFRRIYQQTAESMIFTNPLTGVGLGNFIPASKIISSDSITPWRQQPVHNLYLLIASEIGLIGLLLFLLTILFYTIDNLRLASLLNHPLNLLFALILLAGFFDHYFWTLHQGQLIFWIVLALVSVSKTKKIDSPKYHFKLILKNVRQFLKKLS